MQSIPVTNSLFAITTSKKSNKDKYSLDENYTLKIKNVINKKNPHLQMFRFDIKHQLYNLKE